MNSNNRQNPLHSPELERALRRRAKEDLERKAMEKVRMNKTMSNT